MSKYHIVGNHMSWLKNDLQPVDPNKFDLGYRLIIINLPFQMHAVLQQGVDLSGQTTIYLLATSMSA